MGGGCHPAPTLKGIIMKDLDDLLQNRPNASDEAMKLIQRALNEVQKEFGFKDVQTSIMFLFYSLGHYYGKYSTDKSTQALDKIIPVMFSGYHKARTDRGFRL